MKIHSCLFCEGIISSSHLYTFFPAVVQQHVVVAFSSAMLPSMFDFPDKKTEKHDVMRAHAWRLDRLRFEISPPGACFSRHIDNFSRQDGEVTLSCVTLLQNKMVYMHNFRSGDIDQN